MKNVVLLLLVFIMLFIGACAGPSTPAGTPKPTIIDLSAQATRIYSDEVYIDAESVSLEQMIEYATNVVKAECVQTIYNGRTYEHTFEIRKQYKGEIAEKQIHITINEGADVHMMDKGYSYTRQNKYYPGYTYILLLGCRRSVYYERNKFSAKQDIYIPVENVWEASMYNRPIHENSRLTQTQTKSFGIVEQHIIRECAACSSEGNYTGKEYIHSDNLSDILTQSPYVLQVEIVSFRTDQMEDGLAECYDCKVLKTYKGNVKEEVSVNFFADTVSIGERYIVALTSGISAKYYQFSAKDSLISVNQEPEVLEILQFSEPLQ